MAHNPGRDVEIRLDRQLGQILIPNWRPARLTELRGHPTGNSSLGYGPRGRGAETRHACASRLLIFGLPGNELGGRLE